MAKDRPGIMVYFDTIPSFKRLSHENAGRLIVAMLEYGERGLEPDFSDSDALDIAWSFTRPKIDRDNENYKKSTVRSKYGVYKRETLKAGDEPLDFETWYEQYGASPPHDAP